MNDERKFIRTLETRPQGKVLIFEAFEVAVTDNGQIVGELQHLVLKPDDTYFLARDAERYHRILGRPSWNKLLFTKGHILARMINQALARHIVDQRLARATRRVSRWQTPIDSYNAMAAASPQAVERVLTDDVYAMAVMIAGNTAPDTIHIEKPWDHVADTGLRHKDVALLATIPPAMKESLCSRTDLSGHIWEILAHDMRRYPWIRSIPKAWVGRYLQLLSDGMDTPSAIKSIKQTMIALITEKSFDAIFQISIGAHSINREIDGIMRALPSNRQLPLSTDFQRVVTCLASLRNMPIARNPARMVRVAMDGRTGAEFGLSKSAWTRIQHIMADLNDIHGRVNKARLWQPGLGPAVYGLVRKHNVTSVREAIQAYEDSTVSTTDHILEVIDLYCQARAAGISPRNLIERIFQIRTIPNLDSEARIALLRDRYHPVPSNNCGRPEWLSNPSTDWPEPPEHDGDAQGGNHIPGSPGIMLSLAKAESEQVKTSHTDIIGQLLRFQKKLADLADLEDQGRLHRSTPEGLDHLVVHDGHRILATLWLPYEEYPRLHIRLRGCSTNIILQGCDLSTTFRDMAAKVSHFDLRSILPCRTTQQAIRVIATTLAIEYITGQKDDKRGLPDAGKNLRQHYWGMLERAGIILYVQPNHMFLATNGALIACADEIEKETKSRMRMSATALIDDLRAALEEAP